MPGPRPGGVERNRMVPNLLLVAFLLVCLCVNVSRQFIPMPSDLLYFLNPFFDPVDLTSEERCIDGLDCFRRDGHFAHPSRPVNVAPETRDEVATKLFLYSRRNPLIPQRIHSTVASLNASHFEPQLRTIMLVHGYFYDHPLGRFQKKALRRLMDAMLRNEDANVVLVDWGKGATTWYFQASANTRVVGAEVAAFLRFLSEQADVSLDRCHIIGHSLGSHVAGYAGMRLKGLGRITALDPAKPYFEGTHSRVRLDRDDARFVDVFHTDASTRGNDFSLGSRQLMGDVDYFPNSGDDQPTCKSRKFDALLQMDIFEVLREAFTCDHSRSIDFMTHLLSPELKDGCTPIAYKCSSWRAFESGHCFSCGKHGENCIIMGAEAKIVPSLPRMGYYSKTTEHSPYCGKSLACADVVFLTDISKAHQFRVEMSLLSDCPNSRIYITVLDSKANRVHGFTRPNVWKKHTTYAFVIASGNDMPQPEAIEIKSDFRDLVTRLPCWLDVAIVKLTPLNFKSDHVKAKKTLRLCNFRTSATRKSNLC